MIGCSSCSGLVCSFSSLLISNLSNNPIKSVLDESVEVLDVLLPIGSPLSIVTTAGTTPVADNLGDDDFGGSY